MGARVYLIWGVRVGLRRCDVMFSQTFIGGHLGNGPQVGARRLIWNTIYYSVLTTVSFSSLPPTAYEKPCSVTAAIRCFTTSGALTGVHRLLDGS